MTGFQILAADAADGGVTADGAGERTIGDGTGVASTDTAQTVTAAVGGNCTADPQILDYAAGLEIPEQSLDRAVCTQGKSGDGIAAAVKGAAEGGNGCKAGACQVQITGQHDGFSL